MPKSSRAEIEVTLGGEKRTLALWIDDLEELEARTGFGIGTIVDHLQVGYRIFEIRTIYQIAIERMLKSELDPEKRSKMIKADKENVLRLMMFDSVQSHIDNCIRLINAAFEPIPSKKDGPGEESGSSGSPSGAT